MDILSKRCSDTDWPASVVPQGVVIGSNGIQKEQNMKRVSAQIARTTTATVAARRVDSDVDPVWDDEADLSWTKDYGTGDKCRRYPR
jgi:hypothetical protein